MFLRPWIIVSYSRYVRIVFFKKAAWRMCTRPHTSYRCFPSQIRELRGDYPGDSINSDILGIVLKISDNPRDQWLRMGVRIFLTNGSGNQKVRLIKHYLNYWYPVHGADREQPADAADGADHQGYRVHHHRHLCSGHAGHEDLHEGEGQEEGGTEECSSSSDILWGRV